MNCPAENLLRAYGDGELESARASEFEQHLAQCSQCRGRLAEITSAAAHVQAQLGSLDGAASETVDPRMALSRFKAQVADSERRVPILARLFAPRWRPVWVTSTVVLLLGAFLAFPSGRSLAQRLLATLRVERVQPVRLDFSSVDGNRPLQQMIGQMVSDKVVVTVDEKPQHPANATDAAQLAGFPVRLLSARVDSPRFTVEGQHAFHMTIDRARLQEIFDQSGRPDLLLPATLDGATISVQIPRSVTVQYGDCAREGNREHSGPPAAAPQLGNCLALEQAPSPVVSVPAEVNIQQLAEIALQFTGMSAEQAREFCQTIDWKSTLVLPIPRYAGSYSVVEVNGVQGTLITHNDRRGSQYALIWVKNGIIYGLAGQGDSSAAVKLASSLD
jgi:putative zinc finger protein